MASDEAAWKRALTSSKGLAKRRLVLKPELSRSALGEQLLCGWAEGAICDEGPEVRRAGCEGHRDPGRAAERHVGILARAGHVREACVEYQR